MPPSYLDIGIGIGIGRHFEGFGGCKIVSDLPRRQKQFLVF